MTQKRTFRRITRGTAGMTLEFEGLVRSQSPRYFSYALRYLGNPQDAEEVVSDACLELHRRWPKVLESKNAYAFAFKIFKDTLLKRLSIMLKQPALGPLDGFEPSSEDDGYGAVEARIALGEALAELERTSPRQAECVRMHYFAHNSYEEIAAALDITVAAAKASTSLGKRRLCRSDTDDTPLPNTGDRDDH